MDATTIPRTRFLLIRHGETVWNREERFQGHGDSPLTETGREQVRALGRRLRPLPIDRLVTSDLGRTLATASLIAEATGLSVLPDARLRERHYGVLEGLTVPEIQRDHGDVLERLRSDDPDYVIPSGESHRQTYRRHVAFLESELAGQPGKTIAVVSHGGLLDSAFRFVSGLALHRPRCFVTVNASVTTLAHGVFYGTPRWVIETWCDCAHLDAVGYREGL